MMVFSTLMTLIQVLEDIVMQIRLAMLMIENAPLEDVFILEIT